MAEFSRASRTSIDFFIEKHVVYIKRISSDTDSFEFIVSQHLRMSGVYWGLCAMSIMGINLQVEMNADAIVDWVMRCQAENGGYKTYDKPSASMFICFIATI